MHENMKCPFRQKDGEFCECYGKSCMAYCEYEAFQIAQDYVQGIKTPVVNRICKRVAAPVTYGCV